MVLALIRTTSQVAVDDQLADVKDENDEHRADAQLELKGREGQPLKGGKHKDRHLNYDEKCNSSEHDDLAHLLDLVWLESSHEGLTRLDPAELHLLLKLEIHQ